MKGFKNSFLDALTGFALGLFPTVIAGTILNYVGLFIGNDFGRFVVSASELIKGLVGVGIGIGVAMKLEAGYLTTASSAIAGYIGEYTVKILEKQQISKNILSAQNEGLPICAFVAAFIVVIIGKKIGENNKFSYMYLPVISILSGIAIAFYIGKPISLLLKKCTGLISWAVEQNPMIMGMVISGFMCIACTMPIGIVVIVSTINLPGIAIGAAVAGCCSSMIGYASASLCDNKMDAFLLQSIGTPSLQLPNIVRKPITFLPVFFTSVIAGAVSTAFNMDIAAQTVGVGSCGIITQIMSIVTMENGKVVSNDTCIKVLIIQVILPAFVAWSCSSAMRKSGFIEDGDMKVSL